MSLQDILDTEERAHNAMIYRDLGERFGVGEFAAIIQQRLRAMSEPAIEADIAALITDLDDPWQMIEDAREELSANEWKRGVAAGIYPSEEEIAAAMANPRQHPDDEPPF